MKPRHKCERCGRRRVAEASSWWAGRTRYWCRECECKRRDVADALLRGEFSIKTYASVDVARDVRGKR